MSKKLKVKKNQHYVPQSYLRRFTIKGEKSLLWEFEKENSCFKRNTSSVNKICSDDYYYYQQDEQGGFDHIKFEDSLSEVEKIGNDILIKIINSHAMPYSCITEEERGHLSFYIALMLTRGPAFRDCINDIHGTLVWSTLEHMYRSGQLPEMPEVLQKSIESNGFEGVIKAEVFASVSLQHIVEAARQIALSFLDKNWKINVVSGDEFFITSDTPVVFTSSTGANISIGPAHPNTKIIFPISNKVAITIEAVRTSKDLMNSPCSTSEAFYINKLIADAANKSIFCADKFAWLIDHKFQGDGQKMKMESSGTGYEIINNPYTKRKLTKNSSGRLRRR